MANPRERFFQPFFSTLLNRRWLMIEGVLVEPHPDGEFIVLAKQAENIFF